MLLISPFRVLISNVLFIGIVIVTFLIIFLYVFAPDLVKLIAPKYSPDDINTLNIPENTPKPVILSDDNFIHKIEEVMEEQNKRLLYVCGGVSVFETMLPYVKNWIITKYDIDVRSKEILGRFIPKDYDPEKIVRINPRYFSTVWYLLERNKFENIDYTVRCYDVAAARSYYNMFDTEDC